MKKRAHRQPALVTLEPPELRRRIHTIRGLRVMLDTDLAALYGVSTTRLNEQLHRNVARFPKDFAFQLSTDENRSLISQTARSNPGRGGRRKLPFAFTEHGAIMAATVLRSPVAIQASVSVVRAFVKLRRAVAVNAELLTQVAELTRKYGTHDKAIRRLDSALKELMSPFDDSAQPLDPSREPIGFRRLSPPTAPSSANLLASRAKRPKLALASTRTRTR